MTPWDAVVLAGGRGSRLGGVDKPALLVGERSLLGAALAATAGARHRVAVGPARGASDAGVPRVLEEPRFGGPVVALGAGMRALPHPSSPLVAVLAADQPAAAPALGAMFDAVDARRSADGWLAVDPSGRRQPLLAVYRSSMLRAALDDLQADGGLEGASMRRLLAYLDLAAVPLPAALCADVDTREDLAAARTAAARALEGAR